MTYIRRLKPAPFVPTTSVSGDEQAFVISGENMWLRYGRAGSSVKAEGYTGNLSRSETIPTKTLTGTITWTTSLNAVTGSGTLFVTELRPGSFVFADSTVTGTTQLFVVERIDSNTSFISTRVPDTTMAVGKTAYVLPVLFPIGTDRGTQVRGNTIQFPKGHYVGVGDGTFRKNGTALSATLSPTRTPQFSLYNPTAGTYTSKNVGLSKPVAAITLTAFAAQKTITGTTVGPPIVVTSVAHGLTSDDIVTITGVVGMSQANGTFYIVVLTADTFQLVGITGTGAWTSGGLINPSLMRAGDYNIRVSRYNSSTLGYSNPSNVISPVTLTVGQSIKVVFNEAMETGQDGYIIWGSQFLDSSGANVEARYNGPWFEIKRITKTDLINAAHPLGTEAGTHHIFSYSDAEIQTATETISFDNFAPVDAEFVDLINGTPIYFSCLGKGTSVKTGGTSPGPVAVPAKPSNPEAVLLNKSVTTALGDYIIGEFNIKSRIYALCQNSLQELILTTVDDEPITFRSLWNTGFRNPYNASFIKNYIYAYTTQRIVRSVAGGDDTNVEFEFVNDIRDYIVNWDCGSVLTAYDPQNNAMCFFFAAAERRGNFWVTICLPFLIDAQVWNPPIVLSKTNTDFIVSGVATVGSRLEFLAGGRDSGGTVAVETYCFDGGDSETKAWFLTWNYSDDQQELTPKTIKGFSATGRFNSSATAVKVYGVGPEDSFDLTGLAAGTSADNTITLGNTSGNVARKRLKLTDWGPYSLYAARIEGSYTTTADRFDELVLQLDLNNSTT